MKRIVMMKLKIGYLCSLVLLPVCVWVFAGPTGDARNLIDRSVPKANSTNLDLLLFRVS